MMDPSLEFSDEDIQSELKKMGYSHISENLLKMFKEDLRRLIQQEQSSHFSSPSSLSSLTPLTSSSSNERSSNLSQSIVIDGRVSFDNGEHTYPKTFYESNASDFAWKAKTTTVNNNNSNEEECLSTGPLSSFTEDSNTPKIVADENVSEIRRKNMTSEGVNGDTLKENKNSANNISCSSSRTEKIIKRKIAGFKNGKLFITEEERIVPSDTDLLSADTDGSNKEPSSTGSNTVDTSSMQRLSGSADYRRPRYVLRPVLQPLPALSISRRKCDPVTRYHQYRKYWETFKPPGEQSHKDLRWSIRGKMLEYDI